MDDDMMGLCQSVEAMEVMENMGLQAQHGTSVGTVRGEQSNVGSTGGKVTISWSDYRKLPGHIYLISGLRLPADCLMDYDRCWACTLLIYKELPSSDLRFGTHPDGRSILVMLYDVRDERKLRKKIALLARNSEPHSIWAEAVVTARPWTQELTPWFSPGDSQFITHDTVCVEIPIETCRMKRDSLISLCQECEVMIMTICTNSPWTKHMGKTAYRLRFWHYHHGDDFIDFLKDNLIPHRVLPWEAFAEDPPVGPADNDYIPDEVLYEKVTAWEASKTADAMDDAFQQLAV